jgi:hypothetical protein
VIIPNVKRLDSITYHLDGKPPFLIGELSNSMDHLYHGYVSHNQRVVFECVKKPVETPLN